MNTTIAIDLGGTNVRVARVREGKIEARLSEPVKASGTEREVLDQMCALVEKVNNGTASRIGVAVPSVVDFNTGIVYNVMNIPSWKEVHLKQYLESRFGIETHADNDVNCFVAAEKAYGAGRPFDNLVGITLGTGVGAGIVIDGKVYRGANTGAGEICSLPYLESNYEDYTSQQLFNKWHTTALAEADKARAGDPVAIARWHELGLHLGKLLQVILYTYDPQAIVIGGGIAASRDLFERAMLSSAREGFQQPHIVDKVSIIFSSLADCNMLGASLL